MLTALQHFNIFFYCQFQKWHKEVGQGAHSFYTFLSLTIYLILSITKCIFLMLIVHLTFYLTKIINSLNLIRNAHLTTKRLMSTIKCTISCLFRNLLFLFLFIFGIIILVSKKLSLFLSMANSKNTFSFFKIHT